MDIQVEVDGFDKIGVVTCSDTDFSYYPYKKYKLNFNSSNRKTFIYFSETELDQLIEALNKIKNEQR